jgi:hypothetical protein
MAVQQFHLLGDPVSSAKNIELDEKANVDDVKDVIASHFAIVSPNGEPVHYLFPKFTRHIRLLRRDILY